MPAETIYARHRVEALVGAGGLLLTALSVLLGVFVLRRPRLHVDSDGLVVANLLRTYRIPWRDVAGFGFGTTGATPCLTVRRTDGSLVGAAVVNDNYRSGYSQATRSSPISRTGSPPRTARAEPRARTPCPRLGGAARGCRVTGVRHHECKLTLAGRTWTYSEDYPQFNGLATGAPVEVLVDPRRPTTVYTAHDVAVRSDAGFGVLAIVGIVFAVAGFLGLAFLLWLQHLARVTRSRFSGNA